VRTNRMIVSSLLGLVVISILLCPTVSSAQYTPTTSITRLSFPSQVTNGSARVSFLVSYVMGGYSRLDVYIWDLDAQRIQAGIASPSPDTCPVNSNSNCLLYMAPYSVGVESMIFQLNLSSGTHHFEARASITDSNNAPIGSTSSQHQFSIIASSNTTTTQSLSITTQIAASQSYQAVPQETQQQTTQSSETLPANSSPLSLPPSLLWVALALSIVSVIASLVVLLRPPRRFEKVVFEEDGSLQKVDREFTSSKSAMFCRYCGVRIPRDSKFCQECGAKLA